MMSNLFATALAFSSLLFMTSAHAQYPDMQPTGRIEILTYGDARFGIETEHLRVASGRQMQSMKSTAVALYGGDDFESVAYRRPSNHYGNIQTVSHQQPVYRSPRRIDPMRARAIARELSQQSGGYGCQCSRFAHPDGFDYRDQGDDLVRRMDRGSRVPRVVRVGY